MIICPYKFRAHILFQYQSVKPDNGTDAQVKEQHATIRTTIDLKAVIEVSSPIFPEIQKEFTNFLPIQIIGFFAVKKENLVIYENGKVQTIKVKN